MSPARRQAAGGAIIAVPGNVIDIVLMSIVFFGWIQNVKKTQRERERLQYAAEDAVANVTTPAQAQPAGGEAQG